MKTTINLKKFQVLILLFALYIICYFLIILKISNLLIGIYFILFSGYIAYIGLNNKNTKKTERINFELSCSIIVYIIIEITAIGFLLANLGLLNNLIVTSSLLITNIIYLAINHKNVTDNLKEEITIKLYLNKKLFKSKFKLINSIILLVSTLFIISGTIFLILIPSQRYMSVIVWIESINNENLSNLNYSSEISVYTISNKINITLTIMNPNHYSIQCILSVYTNNTINDNRTISLEKHSIQLLNYSFAFEEYALYKIEFNIFQLSSQDVITIVAYILYIDKHTKDMRII